MALFIPTSGARRDQYIERMTGKGQLYNLDLDEFITFQFNPTQFSWSRETNWQDVSYYGDSSGGDIQYINTKAREIDLPLLYIAAPGAPEIQFKSKAAGVYADNPSNQVVDFTIVKNIIERWEEKIEGVNRPSIIMIIFGELVFTGVIKNTNYKLIECFEDLSPKESLLTLEFRDWNVV